MHAIHGDTQRDNRVLQQQTKLAPHDAATMSLLRQLHPDASEPLPPLPHHTPTTVIIPVKVVRDLILTKCNNTAAGDSAIVRRNKHLLPLVHSTTCMQGIAAFLLDIVSGVFVGAAKHVLTTCTLVPLAKPQGGVRPIGIGNTFARLAKIYAVKACQLDYTTLFPSIQLGVGHSNGCERVLHTLQAFHAYAPVGNVICSTDIKNAFNSRRRIDMWNALLQQPSCQPLQRLVYWSYNLSSTLCVYEGPKLFDTVLSAEGAIQGDPVAALLFALSMQPMYTKCIEGTEVKALAIQDDFYLMGEVKEVAKCISKLQSLCTDADLVLAVNKCTILPCRSNVTETEEHIKRIEQVASSTNIKVDEKLNALGGVLSNYQDDVSTFVLNMVNQQQSYFDLLCNEYLPPQIAYKMLRDCANPSMSYITRVCNTELIGDALVKWDNMSLAALFNMHQIDVESLGDTTCNNARKQAQLPLSRGGMGITSMYQAANAAYMSSLLTAHDDISKLQLGTCNNTQSDDEKEDEINNQTTQSTTVQYKSNTVLNIQYMNERNVDVLSITGAHSIQQLCETPSMHAKLQHKLMDKLHVYNFTQLQSSVTAGHKAVLLSCSQIGAARWLINMFDSGDKLFKPTLWNAAVRHRLYICPSDIMCSDLCECGKSSSNTRQVQPFSVQPAHFHVCDMMKGQLKQRHDLLKTTLHRLLSDMGAHVTVEPQLRPSSSLAVQSLRADLCVTTANGKKYVDLVLCVPAAKNLSASVEATYILVKHVKWQDGTRW